MKTKQQWNAEYTALCFNSPYVSGQLLPAPQNMEFIESVQRDAIEYICCEVEEKLKALGVATQALKDILDEVSGSVDGAPDCSDRSSLANAVYRSALGALTKIGK